MEAITPTAIFDAQDYRAEAEKAARPITFDADAMDALAETLGVQGVPFVKVRVKSTRPLRTVSYIEPLEQGYRICLTAPSTMSTAGLQALLNAMLCQELAKITGTDTLLVTDAYAAIVVTASVA